MTEYTPLLDVFRDVTRPELGWLDDALCAQVDPELFFPEPSVASKDAKSVCMACPVRADCLEYALAGHIMHGVFGGKSEKERRPLLAARRNLAGAA